MTTIQQPSAHPRWDAFTRSFKQSNYITDFWNWFMTLISKAAEMVLFGTVLYLRSRQDRTRRPSIKCVSSLVTAIVS